MKFVTLLVVIFLASCCSKELVDNAVNRVYPHLLKIEQEYVQELYKLGKKYDIRSEEEMVIIKEKIFDLIAKDTTTLSHEFGPCFVSGINKCSVMEVNNDDL